MVHIWETFFWEDFSFKKWFGVHQQEKIILPTDSKNFLGIFYNFFLFSNKFLGNFKIQMPINKKLCFTNGWLLMYLINNGIVNTHELIQGICIHNTNVWTFLSKKNPTYFLESEILVRPIPRKALEPYIHVGSWTV